MPPAIERTIVSMSSPVGRDFYCIFKPALLLRSVCTQAACSRRRAFHWHVCSPSYPKTSRIYIVESGDSLGHSLPKLELEGCASRAPKMVGVPLFFFWGGAGKPTLSFPARRVPDVPRQGGVCSDHLQRDLDGCLAKIGAASNSPIIDPCRCLPKIFPNWQWLEAVHSAFKLQTCGCFNAEYGSLQGLTEPFTSH